MILTHADGHQVERYYENDGIREIEELDDRKIERIYNQDQVLLKEEINTSTNQQIIEYHLEGWVQYQYIEDMNNWKEMTYQADGIILSEASSIGWKNIYNSEGIKTEAYDIDDKGRTTHVFFIENGKSVIYIYEFDGSITKCIMTSDGLEELYVPNYAGEEVFYLFFPFFSEMIIYKIY